MLKRALLIVMLAASVASCDDDTPTSPADPNVAVFSAQLSAQNEVPPLADSNAESAARGSVLIEMRLSRDAGNNITGATVTFVVNLTNFPNGSVWTLAHIHEGASTVAGPVRVNTGLSPGTAITLTNGIIAGQRFENITVVNTTGSDALRTINGILNDTSNWYFNAHTQLNGGGAVRGQLVRSQ